MVRFPARYGISQKNHLFMDLPRCLCDIQTCGCANLKLKKLSGVSADLCIKASASIQISMTTYSYPLIVDATSDLLVYIRIHVSCHFCLLQFDCLYLGLCVSFKAMTILSGLGP